ncbi:MAG TPA: ISL3 family transposase, partial [Ktedonobacteraceae bacterium]|nr:ISL3 family transposase [Ktedonobacteraceae bacterium]
MPSQHTTEEAARGEGIFVPLGLSELHVLKQEWQANGTIRAEVIATTTQAICPHCQKTCVKIHDTRARKKRDVALRDHQVELILYKRRFRCLSCKKRFTEPDTACGKKRRTTKRFRETIGKQASIQPVAHVAKTCGVSHHLVQHCFEAVATQEIERKGLAVKEDQPLHTPRFLGIDEFATRKGHRYDTILCDLEARQVVEVSAGRKLEDVTALLERLCDPDAVKAVSREMSASFRPAVQLCLPKAQIVVDHFHVIQHVMKGFKKVLSSWAHQKEGKPLLEGRQQLFLKAKEELTEKQAKARTHLGELLPWLETAWQLKEELRTWYATTTAVTAAMELDSWIEKVQQHGPELMRKTLSAFKNWRQEILAFFQFLPARISHGFVEGKNHRDLCLDAPGLWVSPSPAPSSAHFSWRCRLNFLLISLQR